MFVSIGLKQLEVYDSLFVGGKHRQKETKLVPFGGGMLNIGSRFDKVASSVPRELAEFRWISPALQNPPKQLSVASLLSAKTGKKGKKESSKEQTHP